MGTKRSVKASFLTFSTGCIYRNWRKLSLLMKRVLLLITLFIAYQGYSQCPLGYAGYTVTLGSSDGRCLGTVLHVSSTHAFSKIVWCQGNTVVSTAPATTSFSQTGIVVAGGHGNGIFANQLGDPLGIFVDSAENLYVADDNDYITEWTPGEVNRRIVAGNNGYGGGLSQLDYAYAVFLDKSGNIYVSDHGNQRVMKWAPGATSGITVIQGPTSSNIPQPNGLSSMFVDYAGDVYFSTRHSPVIQEWTPGATSWTTVVTGYSTGLGPEYLCLFLDNRGNLYAGDGDSSAVFKYERQMTIDTSFTPTVPGIYYAVATDINGQPVTTDSILIKAPPGPTSLQVSASATSVPVCTPLNFTATPVNPGGTPFYQWQVSGVNVGGDSLQYSNNIFANGDQVICILNTVDGCTGVPNGAAEVYKGTVELIR